MYQAALYCERCGEAIRAELGNADNLPPSSLSGRLDHRTAVFLPLAIATRL